MKWYQLDEERLFEMLETSKDGLTDEEAKRRLEKYGLNKLPEKKKDSIGKVFIRQFMNPIVFILLIAGIFSLLIGELKETIFIWLVVVLNGVLGTFQEWKAKKNAESLQNYLKIQTEVVRNGKEVEFDSENIVIGDIVILDTGDKIAADLRLINTSNLSINESFLTGESIAASKHSKVIENDTKVSDQKNMCFAGSTVMSGRAIGIVVATGTDTEIGKIASNVILSKETKTPLVIRMEKFTKQIGFLVLVIAIVLTILLLLQGNEISGIFFAVIALSISAIPESLPVVLTVALSIATSRMAKKNVIVSKLNAVESLGSCTVIASDKTGTLTLNEQTAKLVVLPSGIQYEATGQGYHGNGQITMQTEKESEASNLSQLQEIGNLVLLNNEAKLYQINNHWESIGDAMDIALLALSYKIGRPIEQVSKNEIIDRIPYESQNKYSAVFYHDKNRHKGTHATVKGSVETILEFCDYMFVDGKLKKIDTNLILQQNNELAKKGYRVLAIAKKENYQQKDNVHYLKQFTLLGLVAFIDPIREEVPNSINKCKEAGIKVVMITGDHPLTAGTIAKQLNILENDKQIVTGNDIDHYLQLGDERFDKLVKESRVFARVTPIQKLAIVNSFKRQGEFIAVTGDGVNDAPAMRSANIGIAMGSGTDVAKETGGMIIIDDNFLSVVSGIEEGRHAYNNVRKVIYMLLSCSVAEVFFFMVAIMLNTPIPMLPVQILWVNLITNGIQDIALAFEKGEKGVMKMPPRKPNENIFDKLLIQETLISGITICIIVSIFWYQLLPVVGVEVARSYILLLMVFIQLIHTFNCRSETISAFRIPIKNNRFVVYAIFVTLALQFIVSETTFMSDILGIYPLTLENAITALLLSFPILIVMELFKLFKRRELKRKYT